MLDIKFIRENPELIQAAATKKRADFKVEELIEVDTKRLGLLAAVEALRRQQNEASQKIATITDHDVRNQLIVSMKAVKDKLSAEEAALAEVMKSWQRLMLAVPNLPDISVPDGASDADNQEIRTWGEKTALAFPPRDHVDLLTSLDLADFERGAKVSGFRGYFLKNAGARLEWGLFQYAWQFFQARGGFIPLSAPSLVNREAFLGTGYLPAGEEDLYKTQDDQFLAGTAEVATMAYYADEILPAESLPQKFLAFSPCFRREAGSHGKDTRGLFRVHEFFKLEQVVLCEASHETSVRLHEELTANSEAFLQSLNLPYRVVVNCGADLGQGQVKKYDLEAWMPSENTYRETHSSSYFHDFQTRRLNIRYRDAEGKLRFVHSLNNTAVAAPRILAHLVENNQQADGSVKIPEVLIPFVGTDILKR